jgi:hypothetical protein
LQAEERGRADKLPPEVVEYRRRVTDLLWDPQRYVSFGMNDKALGAHGFAGRCWGCSGPLSVRFHPYEEAVTLTCVFKGCDIADAVNERLGLVTE